MPLAATLEPFICGGLAACTASTCIHPIDLAKVRLQLFATMNTTGAKIPSPVAILSDMIKKDGFTSIYAGLSAAILRQAIYGTARIGLHRTFSDMLVKKNKGKPVSFAAKTGSGMLSGAIAVCIGTPLDVALVRMQSDSMKPLAEQKNYSNVFNCVGRVIKEEGVGKLYAGLLPNVLRGMAMNVGMLSCYDQALEVFCKHVYHEDVNKPSVVSKLSASMTAGFTAAAFSLPFDMIKSRLQAGGSTYTGVMDVAVKIVKTEGILAFWTGFTAYYGRCAPHAMIVLMLTDTLSRQYRKMTA